MKIIFQKKSILNLLRRLRFKMNKACFFKNVKERIHIILSELGIKKRRDKIVADFINKFKFEVYVGIGIYNGIVAKRIIKYCKSLKKIFLIDPYKTYINPKGILISQFDINRVYRKMSLFFRKFKKVKLIRKNSKEASKMFKEKTIDLVFIDALHTYDFIRCGDVY